MTALLDRFLTYVKIDTQSDEDSGQHPSTEKQFVLAEKLYEELKAMGASDVRLDRTYCYVYAKIPSNMAGEGCDKVPAIGFIAHMDTSPEVTDTDVKPRVIRDYDGKDILLNEEKNIILSPQEYPYLNTCTGRTLIVTDGTTLLGADDKAGVAEIMSAAEYLLAHPEIKHGDICIGFTPDEEIGSGVDFFDIKGFGADYAYTVDGGGEGEIEFENFNAASALVEITGKSIHPGSAKGIMKNACLIASEFAGLLPAEQTPAHTEGYEGFYHLCAMEGSIEHAKLEYIIRDHDMNLFEEKKAFMEKAAAFINSRYGEGTVKLTLKDSYYNMKEKILPVYHLIETAVAAMEEEGVEPKIVPIRGGTDGARLSYEGLPCPNLYTGGQNYHGRFEYACLETMESMVRVIINIIRRYAS